MKFAVIGKTGQLGRALEKKLSAIGIQSIFYDRNALDLLAPKDAIEATLESMPTVDAIIIAAAFTAVDRAEDERAQAMAINAHSPGIIAEHCKRKQIPLIHISTDYVFNGKARLPYTPEDAIDPINFYGESKLAGEKSVFEIWDHTIIIRTSWVFDGEGSNFFTTMLRLGKTHSNLKVVSDQIGRPTYSVHLADAVIEATLRLIDTPNVSGVYHFTGSGEAISWAKFAKEIFAIAAPVLNHEVQVQNIPSSEYPTRAKRPEYSVLDLTKFEQTFSYALKDWRDGLKEAYSIWNELEGAP